MSNSKKIAWVSPDCVACGCCIKICPLGAISVPKGIQAEVNGNKCVGCGKCAQICPAQVITILTKEVPYVKTQAVV